MGYDIIANDDTFAIFDKDGNFVSTTGMLTNGGSRTSTYQRINVRVLLHTLRIPYLSERKNLYTPNIGWINLYQ
jgi:hypothetical protein